MGRHPECVGAAEQEQDGVGQTLSVFLLVWLHVHSDRMCLLLAWSHCKYLCYPGCYLVVYMLLEECPKTRFWKLLYSKIMFRLVSFKALQGFFHATILLCHDSSTTVPNSSTSVSSFHPWTRSLMIPNLWQGFSYCLCNDCTSYIKSVILCHDIYVYMITISCYPYARSQTKTSHLLFVTW